MALGLPPLIGDPWAGKALAASRRPSFEAALSAARMRFWARAHHAPIALLGLLQCAGSAWEALLFAVLADLQRVVSPALDQLPPPHTGSRERVVLAPRYPQPIEAVD